MDHVFNKIRTLLKVFNAASIAKGANINVNSMRKFKTGEYKEMQPQTLSNLIAFLKHTRDSIDEILKDLYEILNGESK